MGALFSDSMTSKFEINDHQWFMCCSAVTSCAKILFSRGSFPVNNIYVSLPLQ